MSALSECRAAWHLFSSHQTPDLGMEWQREGLLIEGDFSGIQTFVLKPVLGSKGAAKRLRARSYKVLATSRAVAEEVLKEFAAEKAAPPFSAGGYMMIVPQLAEDWAERFARLQARIDQIHFRHFSGKVSFSFGAASFADELESEAILLHNSSLRKDATRQMSSGGRLSDQTACGGTLFEQQAACLGSSFQRMMIPVRTTEPNPDWEAFQLLSCSRFGKRSAVGSFELVGEPELVPWLDDFAGPQSFATLGHFVPAENDPVEGNWRVHVKYPKYQGNAVDHPFKGRIVTLIPGSWFHVTSSPRAHNGSKVEMKVDEMNVLQYRLAFAAPIKIHPLNRQED